jgi:CDP-paratose 2-epimerase
MKVIITGGAGFIGSNAASRYLKRGDKVVVIDDLSRAGAVRNLEWLERQGLDRQGRLTHLKIDVRNERQVAEAFQAHGDAGLILHLAGQTAVTSSVVAPREDFEANALGTFNVLEGARLAGISAPFIYSSTNKVYGGMTEAKVIEQQSRYGYADLPQGISEERQLDFHSPYGCSKGAADQYVRDYHRIYGLNTVVFRQSCIYGYRQFGVEDQGWVAWFMIASQTGRPITVYGDGKQSRDILFVDDLLDAFEQAAAQIKKTAGRVYNVGGGPENVLSLLDLLVYLEEKQGRTIAYKRDEWRPGDQRVFVSDISRARAELGWSPKVGCQQGLGLLHDWISENKGLFK